MGGVQGEKGTLLDLREGEEGAAQGEKERGGQVSGAAAGDPAHTAHMRHPEAQGGPLRRLPLLHAPSPLPRHTHLFVEAVDDAGLRVVLRSQRLVLLHEPLRHTLLFDQPPLQPQLLLGELVDVLVQHGELLAACKPGGRGNEKRGRLQHWGLEKRAITGVIASMLPSTSLLMHILS